MKLRIIMWSTSKNRPAWKWIVFNFLKNQVQGQSGLKYWKIWIQIWCSLTSRWWIWMKKIGKSSRMGLLSWLWVKRESQMDSRHFRYPPPPPLFLCHDFSFYKKLLYLTLGHTLQWGSLVLDTLHAFTFTFTYFFRDFDRSDVWQGLVSMAWYLSCGGCSSKR